MKRKEKKGAKRIKSKPKGKERKIKREQKMEGKLKVVGLWLKRQGKSEKLRAGNGRPSCRQEKGLTKC